MRLFCSLLAPLLIAPACYSSPASNDLTHYQRGDCSKIYDIPLADECRMFAVRQQPALADSLCPKQKQPYMRDECWFVAVDAAQLLGEDARAGCQKAGRYAGACIANAISRETTRIKDRHPSDCIGEIRALLLDYHQPDTETQAIRLCR